MSEDVVLSELRGDVALITINRPKALNALNLEVVQTLGAVLHALDQGLGVRVAVLCGAGGKAFVAGADIAWMSGLTPIEAETFAGTGQKVLAGAASRRRSTGGRTDPGLASEGGVT